MEELGTPKRYEAFIREGVKQPYRAEWHPGEQAPFLGAAEFVKKLARPRKKDLPRQPLALEVLMHQAAKQKWSRPSSGARRRTYEVIRRSTTAVY